MNRTYRFENICNRVSFWKMSILIFNKVLMQFDLNRVTRDETWIFVRYWIFKINENLLYIFNFFFNAWSFSKSMKFILSNPLNRMLKYVQLQDWLKIKIELSTCDYCTSRMLQRTILMLHLKSQLGVCVKKNRSQRMCSWIGTCGIPSTRLYIDII